jgi:Predicted amidophosphoribosyltransferases
MGCSDISRERSSFWIRIYENDDGSISFLTTPKIYRVINTYFPILQEMSPKGWSTARNDNRILWIPENWIDKETVDKFIEWANEANTRIWLSKNKNFPDSFNDELDYCIAADWNFSFETQERTPVGEAEYQLKYRFAKHLISEDERKQYADTLIQAVMDCLKFLPLHISYGFLVTTMPALIEDQHKLSWSMAKYVSDQLHGQFLSATLLNKKAQTKTLLMQEKISMWDNIFKSGQVSLSDNVQGKSIIIIDDLYQSGASLWTYAKYLKALKASEVVGIVAVKSQRDSDNQ